MSRTDIIEKKLQKYGQSHVLKFCSTLSQQEQESLCTQIEKINFEQIEELYAKSKQTPNFANFKIEPIEYTDKGKLTPTELKELNDLGANIISQEKLAVVTMAGGQGTRLGYDGPKGTYNMGLGDNKVIFEILCDNLKEAREKYKVRIPWYIMTSDENHEQTVNFFEKHNYLDYGKDNIQFFRQGNLPMLSTEGKLLLEEKGKIKVAADGHGGVFKSMYRNNVIKDMEEKGIDWVVICGVDNILVKMADEILLGLAIKNGTPAAGKSVVKISPEERVGVFCKKNEKPSIIEYIEITEEMANRRDENGELYFGETHIVCNAFNLQALKQMTESKMPYHVAFKKANYIDETGKEVTATEPNAYKFESFIFDAFEDLENMSILRVKREEEFAPVKNKEGKDSPETARELFTNYQNTRRK